MHRIVAVSLFDSDCAVDPSASVICEVEKPGLSRSRDTQPASRHPKRPGFLAGPSGQRSTSESRATGQSAVIRNSAFGLIPSTLALVGATATITTERMQRRRSARPIHIGDRSTFMSQTYFQL